MKVPEDVRLRVWAMSGRWRVWAISVAWTPKGWLQILDIVTPDHPSGGRLRWEVRGEPSLSFRDWDALRVGLDWLEENGWPEGCSTVSYRTSDGQGLSASMGSFQASADLVRHPTSAQLGALGFLMSGEEG